MRKIVSNMPQLNRKQTDWLFCLSLLMFSLFAFLFLGADGYVLFDDSGSYIDFLKYVEGVMPVYPLFLWANRALFGEAVYLNIVIIEQALFAAFCIILFTHVIRKQFALKYWEAYGIYALSLLPFTTDMPDAMTTQEILTEGIAYAAFYLFIALLLKTVWTKDIKWMVGLFFMTFFLAATRSQLQILFGVCGIIFLYILLTRKKLTTKRVIVSLVIGLMGCILISLVGVWSTNRISGAYQVMIRNIGIKIELEKIGIKDSDEQIAQEQDTEETDTTVTDTAKEKPALTSQYVSLIFSRGMYEADYEDCELFEKEELRDLYLLFYQVADENECLYTYAQSGLWMWKDIVGGIGSVGSKCFYAVDGNVDSQDMLAIGMMLIKAHWPRVFYHTLMLLPQAFICTVFFQIEKIYLLCHLVTLFLYLSALALMIWAFADKKVDRDYAEFMAAVLGTNMVMVVIISLAFFGQQRYLVYNFGIFYIIYFLLVLQWWKLYGKNWLQKWRKRAKS